jgi:hypothetical protein
VSFRVGLGYAFVFGVCLEEALVLVPRPWMMRRGATYLFFLALSAVVLPIAIGLGMSHQDLKVFLSVVFVAGGIGLLLIHRQIKEAFRQKLSRAPAGELLRRTDTMRFNMATVRSLKTNALRLLVVREGHEDLILGILGMRDAVDSAIGSAYPSVHTRES